jgi:hypothetical protein
MSSRNLVGSRAGASPAVVIATVLLVVMLAFVLRGALGSDEAPPAAPPRESVNPIIDAQAKAAQVDAELRRAAAMNMEDVGYGPITPPGPIDPNLRWRLESLLSGAESLVRRGRSEAMRIPDADVDAGLRTQQARANTTAWNNWSRSWDQRVDAYARELTQAGGIAFDDPAYMVYQDLTFLVNDLRTLPMSYATTTNIPLVSERESKFSAAEYRIDEARERLKNLQ